jgi:hypothetical protein
LSNYSKKEKEPATQAQCQNIQLAEQKITTTWDKPEPGNKTVCTLELPLLHMWLPLAHPVAPTPASAVLSGPMLNDRWRERSRRTAVG